MVGSVDLSNASVIVIIEIPIFLLFVLAMEYGTSYSPKRVWALTACQGRITDYMTNFAAFGHDTLEDSIILAPHAQKNFHLDVNDVSL